MQTGRVGSLDPAPAGIGEEIDAGINAAIHGGNVQRWFAFRRTGLLRERSREDGEDDEKYNNADSHDSDLAGDEIK
jgi:hypothetical protein